MDNSKLSLEQVKLLSSFCTGLAAPGVPPRERCNLADEVLRAFDAGELSEEERRFVSNHQADCLECKRKGAST